MAQQTAVDWLKTRILPMVLSSKRFDAIRLIELAKQMEKEQIEISDEEIENFAEDKTTTLELCQGFLSGAKWYREQLKKNI